MELDSMTLMVATALVVIVGGVSFLIETVWHSGSMAARLWSLAFIAAITSTVAFIAWLVVEDSWASVAVGNAAFTCAVGFILLGCRSFNGRSLRATSVAVLLGGGATLVSALLEGDVEDGWGGSVIRFSATAVFAVLGAVESRRGAMARRPASAGLTFVLGLAGVYYVGRTLAFVVVGPSDAIFQTWFATPPASIVTISLVVAAVGSLSVLRATETRTNDVDLTRTLGISAHCMLDLRSFELVIDSVLTRAENAGEGYAILALRIDELDSIATAFGRTEADAALQTWHEAVLAAAPLSSVIGEDGSSGVYLGVPMTSPADIRRVAAQVQKRVNDRFLDSAVVAPAIGVGVATADPSGIRAAALVAAADVAARESAASADGSIVVQGA